ncbi:hypothetical protein Aasi_1676 [Candidatus Amoebophilus asiaticus 5a2]|uniref:Uncharacterized protein n=1 Tax=Amoebophilus asiaticus (strain 5a2) TaxID=452471 RepID=C3L3T4_AMOA5|nr:toprim domain-containing protein [Candidatus Amoebophilus asiaticus]ACP20975.1 hypothetical protein Aasi_1676 [Candidatus Amoebophilus asiaticus 5a2]
MSRGLSILLTSEADKKIVVTESPIDALSFKQLHNTAYTLYLATCGSIGQGIAHSLEEVFLQANQQAIGIALFLIKMKQAKRWINR